MKRRLLLFAVLLLVCGCRQVPPLTFLAGTYEVTTPGHNGDIRLSVSFSDSCITDIQVLDQHETPHVGDVVFDRLIPQIIQANGLGVDAVSGASVTSRALLDGVMDAAVQAKVSDPGQFRTQAVSREQRKSVEGTWDVVVVGAGGAGLAAAAEAAQLGNTVLVIEKNAEMGGNTLVSGGIFQCVMPYLVWEPARPEATEGVGYDGVSYPKTKSGPGCIKELETILQWEEKDFDEAYYATHAFEPGDIAQLTRHGVHGEYLPSFKT